MDDCTPSEATDGGHAGRDPAYGRRSDEPVDEWQTRARRGLEDTLGHTYIDDAALDSTRGETVAEANYERQHWTVETEPGVRLPFYLLVPDDGEPPHPVVFTIHGHTAIGKDLAAGYPRTAEQRRQVDEEERDIGRQAVRCGYAAVVPDMRAFGELPPSTIRDGYRACRTMQLHRQLYGRSLVGDRVWDVCRLLEFVESRAELDERRIAITGHSGGGAVALFAGALDERFDVVVPCCYFSTFESSILQEDHCACNYVPGILHLGEIYDIGGLVAPRPFRAVVGATDTLFPLDGARTAYAELRDHYTDVDAADRCELYVGEGGHRFYADGVWPFVESHL